MSDKDDRHDEATALGDKKTYQWGDFDRAGIPRDFYYREYIRLGSRGCPRCGSSRQNIRWVMGPQRNRVFYREPKHGWKWRCEDCSLFWAEPKIIPSLK